MDKISRQLTSNSPGTYIQQELNRLEEIILHSPRISFVGFALVDEEQLLDQLNIVHLNLEGHWIVSHKD
ncbi:MAG: hypothetical protein F6K18_00830 [Okeania sp. SIO2C2]|uniref:hypothetical protein n=1 Tax=Okeania sp. SIO2C2 TaxID=2607787 RepID=UPI0013BB0948|nr:hypothetical protein [Okeania sp. SIO2C2]NEP85484.1 hypothetical protein [Okeania sp. SIO2C2]